ncbi:MAG: mechanosensitive ion channel domain-containing protein [Bacteroidota bacterium]
MNFDNSSIEKYFDKAIEMLMEYGPKLVLAIITLIIGIKIIKFILKLIDKTLENKNYDPSLKPFLHTLVDWGLKIMLFISVASMVGVETTSFIAVIGAAGLAVGFALQGTLSNFAGGVLILIFKPYKVGDFIEAQGYIGTVREIKIFVTELTTPQNRVVIIPNSPMANGSLTNYSIMDKVRVDILMGISYDANIKQAKDLFIEIMKKDSRILADPAPMVAVGELADSSVNIHVRPWVKTADYWNVYFELLEKFKVELDEVGIGIPYPQTDVHLHQVNK